MAPPAIDSLSSFFFLFKENNDELLPEVQRVWFCSCLDSSVHLLGSSSLFHIQLKEECYVVHL